MKVFDALSQAVSFLEQTIPNPRREAEWLLSFLLRTDRSGILAHYRDQLDSSVEFDFFSLVRDRGSGKPLQYIVGMQEFRGLEFEVTTDVLIPRPETELVVDQVLGRLTGPQGTLVDCGTGSGCIAVSIAVESPQAQVIAVDLSPAALKVAKRNARTHKVLDRIQFLGGDLLTPLSVRRIEGKVDCIVSNPPYVPEKDFISLQREVRDWEPKLALLAGSDGLAIYRRLIPQALAVLKKKGHLILEIGFSMKDSVSRLFQNGWQNVKVREDSSGIPRVVVAQKL
jgi:release factor glutamine methyltransferase